MRLITIFLVLISLSSYACMENAIAPVLKVEKFPQPKFKPGIGVNELSGELTALITTNVSGEVTKFKIIKISPSDLPVRPIENSLKNARFSHSEKDYEINIYFDINIPEKIIPIIEL